MMNKTTMFACSRFIVVDLDRFYSHRKRINVCNMFYTLCSLYTNKMKGVCFHHICSLIYRDKKEKNGLAGENGRCDGKYGE